MTLQSAEEFRREIAKVLSRMTPVRKQHLDKLIRDREKAVALSCLGLVIPTGNPELAIERIGAYAERLGRRSSSSAPCEKGRGGDE